MSRLFMPMTSLVLVLSCFMTLTASRHVHRKRAHHHHARQELTPIYTIETFPNPPTTEMPLSAPTMNAGDSVMSDIQNIQQGLTNLPSDLAAFFSAVEARIQQLESALASFIGLGGSAASLTSGIPRTMSVLQSQTISAVTSPLPTVSVPSQSVGAEPVSAITSSTLVPTFRPLPVGLTSLTSSILTVPAPSTLATQPVLPPGIPTVTRPIVPIPSIPSPGAFPAPLDSCDPQAGTPLPSDCLDITTTRHTTLTSTSTTTITTTKTINGSFPITWHIPIPISVTPRPFNDTHNPGIVSSSTLTATPVATPLYTFNATAHDNVAVYYGTTPATEVDGLRLLCADPNVDIAILSFLFSYFGPGDYPAIDFGAGCSGTSQAQRAAGATGLSDCTALSGEISGCQSIGKKVLLSLGGFIANTSFTSDDQAEGFAELLWNLFGAGTSLDPGLRPFGPGVIIDGFDIDNENHNTAHYGTFASALRQQFATDRTKQYYLSCAPQCPLPDESIPTSAMAMADFVWIQFYNNPQCNLGSTGFMSSVAAWSAALNSIGSSAGRSPMMYVGAAAFPGAGSGYVDGSTLASIVSVLNENNLGGIMLWDGSEALENFDSEQKNYLNWAKEALQ